MSQDTGKKPATQEALFPIRTVSKLTGVNAITLRAWESRYGLIKPVRMESGHRMYTQDDIDILNRVVGLLDRGMRIGQVRDELARQEVPATASEAEARNIWERHVNRMLAAVIKFDEAALDESYSELLALYPEQVVTDKLLVPLLEALGTRWEQKKGSVAEEHFFGFYLRSKLDARLHHRVKHEGGRRLLLCCLPGDRHEIGLLLFALAANKNGFLVIVLGADMPTAELSQVCEKARCDAIVLSGTVAPDVEVFSRDLPALVTSTQVPVFVGGSVSVEAADQIERAGAVACGTDVDVGMKIIKQRLSGEAALATRGSAKNGAAK